MKDENKFPVTIGGKERTLAYPVGAIQAMQIALQARRKDGNKANQNADEFFIALWAGLLHEDRSLSVEDVSFMLTAGETKGAIAAVEAAIIAVTAKPRKRAKG